MTINITAKSAVTRWTLGTAALAVPALLIITAPTAQADTQVQFDPGVSIGIPTAPTMNVHVQDVAGSPQDIGTCKYSGTPVAGPGKDLGWPPATQDFTLVQNGHANFSFPLVATGTVWHVVINCGPGSYHNVYDNPAFVW